MSITANSTPRWKAALALGALLATAALLPLHAQAADQKKDQKEQPKTSPALSKPLTTAQTALKDKKWQDALTALKEADANSKKTPYDQHVIDQMTGQASAGVNDWAEVGKRFEAVTKDGFGSPQENQQWLMFATEGYYNAAMTKRSTDKAAADSYLDKTIEIGKKAIEGSASNEVYGVVASAAYVKDDFKDTREVEEKLIKAQIQKGESPTKDNLDLWRSACSKLKDDACLFEAFKVSLTYHPDAELWDQMLGAVIAPQTARDPAAELQRFRLMLETNTLRRAGDYNEFADNAMKSGSPGEAKSILEKGFANDVFTDPQTKAENKKMLTSATTKAAADQASLETLAREVQTSPTGQKLYALGFAYYGYQQYDKAAEYLGQALAKGGVKNEADVRLLLGIAQLKSGHRDQALQTFQQVRGNTALEQIAQLWPLATKTGT
jgi:tetratricopeptide (TPR) repeat protein